MFFKGVRFVKTSDRFIFQNNDQFYNQIAIKNFEIIKKSGLINTDGLFELVKTKNLEKAQKDNWLIVDVRVGIIRKKLLKAILNKRHLVDNVGNSLIIGNGKPYVILKAWTNLQYLYKDFISSVHSYISPTAKILPGAWVIGNSYIGDKCIIGNNSLIRNSFIDDEAVVGYNTEVSSSYVGKKTTLHTNFVGNSIIGNNCHFGYISCTTTLRLDEKNIFIKWRG
ncbi:hypothetical protein KKC08_04910, partial [Patescibacteria group bacterium]|nr:hypothetical protein [Patescibacteria group bacterium]